MEFEPPIMKYLVTVHSGRSPIEQYNTKDSIIVFNTLTELSTGCKTGCIIMETVVSYTNEFQMKPKVFQSYTKTPKHSREEEEEQSPG